MSNKTTVRDLDDAEKVATFHKESGILAAGDRGDLVILDLGPDDCLRLGLELIDYYRICCAKINQDS